MPLDAQRLLLAAAFLAGAAAALLAARAPDLILMARHVWRSIRRRSTDNSQK